MAAISLGKVKTKWKVGHRPDVGDAHLDPVGTILLAGVSGLFEGDAPAAEKRQMVFREIRRPCSLSR